MRKIASARIGRSRSMSMRPCRLWCTIAPRRQIRVSAPGRAPLATCASRKAGMRARRSSEKPDKFMAWVILSLAMDDTQNWPLMTLAEAHARLTAPGMPFETMDAVIRGVPIAVWKHVPATAAELFAKVRAHGAKEFLIHEDQRITYDGFARAVTCLAAHLRE